MMPTVPVQVEADQHVQPEIGVAHLRVGLVQMAVKGQHECQGMLGNGEWGVVVGHVGHAQAHALCGGQVDLVVAGGVHQQVEQA